MERLHRVVALIERPVRALKPAGQQQVGQLRHQVPEVEALQVVADVFAVAIFHIRPLLIAECWVLNSNQQSAIHNQH